MPGEHDGKGDFEEASETRSQRAMGRIDFPGAVINHIFENWEHLGTQLRIRDGPGPPEDVCQASLPAALSQSFGAKRQVDMVQQRDGIWGGCLHGLDVGCPASPGLQTARTAIEPVSAPEAEYGSQKPEGA
ncbi:hypothetical protein BHE90_017740 [Fusarium euwallaceae]|uniref:Uncharacterized protein n=1 Tax=Fusarium euwallaceae TaxID=1147111 RepID=A0A430KWK7_9HYPO|nr:hypothetical protein BHE90_017740 [Fusarium euwallaceae]